MNALGELHERITRISGFFDVMIEDEKEDPARARELASTWARTHQDMAVLMREHRVSKDQVRELTLALLFSDLRDAVARAGMEAGVTQPAFFSWLQDKADTAIASMPHLGRYRELILRRLRNADERGSPTIHRRHLPLLRRRLRRPPRRREEAH
jgi:hypothetical protein